MKEKVPARKSTARARRPGLPAAPGHGRRAPAAPPAIVRALVEALEAANQFITNGIELGFIRMPDASTPDPAHKTPDRIRAAIAAAKEAGL